MTIEFIFIILTLNISFFLLIIELMPTIKARFLNIIC